MNRSVHPLRLRQVSYDAGEMVGGRMEVWSGWMSIWSGKRGRRRGRKEKSP